MGEDYWLLNTHCPSVDSQPEPEELEPLLGGELEELDPEKPRGNCSWVKP